MVFLDIPSGPSAPAWVDQFFSLHDTLILLLDAVLLEAKFPGSALELEQGFAGDRSLRRQAETSTSISQRVL